MPLGIDPRVDFAFKLMLGSPEHPAVTIHFLNAILGLEPPVVEVEILNPLVGKVRSEEKVVVLDVLAKDSLGRRFNIEMQTRLPLALPNRLLFYNCKNYFRQLLEGAPYGQLRPAISICVLDRILFGKLTDPARWHHSFRLRCDQNFSLVLSNDLEFHILELPKFTPARDNALEWTAAEKWLFFLKKAEGMEPDRLAELLVDDPFREALGVLEMISQSPEDYQYYEDRMKAIRDHQFLLNYARQEGRAEGIEEGLHLGRTESQDALIATIEMLQELLPEPIHVDGELSSKSIAELTQTIEELKQRLRDNFKR